MSKAKGRKNMGRRKGSKNKVKSDKISKTNKVDDKSGLKSLKSLKKQRGRPRKIVEPVVEEVLPPSIIYKSTFLGYCPKCYCIVGHTDLESKFIFNCVSCSNRGKVKTLKKDSGIQKPMSKKEYLDGSLKADYYDMPVMNNVQLDAKDLKIRDI